MPRGVSIHIGVNRPRGLSASQSVLQYSETAAWRMAGLANQAGYGSVLVLRGDAATGQAVHGALAGAAAALSAGDILFLSFSGHGTQQPDNEPDERCGLDQAWCLADETLVDDKLAGFWRLFRRGVRILVIADCCHGGGTCRDDDAAVYAAAAAEMQDSPRVFRTPPRGGMRQPGPEPGGTGPCIAAPPADSDGIAASVLLISAAGEDQPAREGLFTRHLLDLCEDGYRRSYCELYREVRRRVLHDAWPQEPRILMLGAPDLEFAEELAFHVPSGAPSRSVVYR